MKMVDPEIERCAYLATETAREKSQSETGEYYAGIWKKDIR